MRTWIDLLEGGASEQPPAIIYHGTSLRALLRIQHLDRLICGQDDMDQEGTFCSADPKIAARYTTDHMYSSPPGGVLALDVASLRAAGCAVESYFYHSGDDGEEWVIGPNNGYEITGMSAHIRGLDLLPNCIADLRADPMCCYTDDEWEDDKEGYAAAVKAFLAAHG